MFFNRAQSVIEDIPTVTMLYSTLSQPFVTASQSGSGSVRDDLLSAHDRSCRVTWQWRAQPHSPHSHTPTHKTSSLLAPPRPSLWTCPGTRCEIYQLREEVVLAMSSLYVCVCVCVCVCVLEGQETSFNRSLQNRTRARAYTT